MKRRRIKALLQNLALLVTSLFLCVAVSEGVLRLAGYGNVEIYEPDPVLYWRLKPNQDCFTKVDRKPVHINSLGTRGPEFLPAKPANTLRLLSFGDSRTFGWGLSEPETYSAVLERRLQEYVGDRQRIEVINVGVNAWSFAQMRAYLRDHGVRYQPDGVILAEANLWTQFSDTNPPEFVRKFMLRVRLKNLLRRFALYHYVVGVKLKAFYERHRTRFIPVAPEQDTLFKEQQQKDPDAFFRSTIEDFCRLARTNGVQPLLVHIPPLDALTGTNASRSLRMKAAVSEALGVPLVDLTSALAPRGKSLYLEADPIHLNAEGNKIIGERLFLALTNWVSR